MESIARRAEHGVEAGFTLVEVTMTIVIMGVVIAPLCMAMIQALNTIPQSGAGIQHSTDTSQLQSAVQESITQAQGYDVFVGLSSGWNQLPFDAFHETSPTAWKPTDQSGILGLYPFKCATQASTNLGNQWNLFDAWWSSSVSAIAPRTDGGTRVELYTMDITVANGTWDKVVVHQWVSKVGAPSANNGFMDMTTSPSQNFTDTNPNGYLTGYCNSASGGETIASLATTMTNDSGDQKTSLALTLKLHTGINTPSIYQTTIQASPRPSGTTDS
jgi:prepilin-type N-terminal cleavage/methylation domain-containing protein